MEKLPDGSFVYISVKSSQCTMLWLPVWVVEVEMDDGAASGGALVNGATGDVAIFGNLKPANENSGTSSASRLWKKEAVDPLTALWTAGMNWLTR